MKGFLIKIAQALKHIITRKLYNNKQIKTIRQDGLKEFISLLAIICANSITILLALIYKGALKDF
jgi:hypothetical protein